jgi:hypothetical protein
MFSCRDSDTTSPTYQTRSNPQGGAFHFQYRMAMVEQAMHSNNCRQKAQNTQKLNDKPSLYLKQKVAHCPSGGFMDRLCSNLVQSAEISLLV